MKALTVRQPWASLIAQGKKTIEIRSWSTKYRGRLLITASAKKCNGLPTGCTICTVDLLDCRPLTPADLAAACMQDMDPAGLYAWVLDNPTPLQNQPIKGRLSIWTAPPDLVIR